MENFAGKIKKFRNEELNLSLKTCIGRGKTICFKGKDIALALDYAKPGNAISKHVDEEHKTHGVSKGDLDSGPPSGGTTHHMEIRTWCLLTNILL